jgi:hypothetical protein
VGITVSGGVEGGDGGLEESDVGVDGERRLRDEASISEIVFNASFV